ncbi:unnamed protein product, partial [Effrenium voratum]
RPCLATTSSCSLWRRRCETSSPTRTCNSLFHSSRSPCWRPPAQRIARLHMLRTRWSH